MIDMLLSLEFIPLVGKSPLENGLWKGLHPPQDSPDGRRRYVARIRI